MKTRNSTWLTRAAVFVLALSVFAACDDASTSPSSLDADAAAATMDQVVSQFVEGNEAVQSLDVFGSLIGGALGTSPSIAFDLIPKADGDGISGLTRDLRLSVTEASEDGAIARIPAGALGKTFVYNPTTGAYEIDETRTDAPSNGVRFILYAVDPVLGQPLDPLQEIGYIDIVDNSSFPTVAVSLTAVVDGVTLIDADVTGTFSQTELTLGLAGFLSDGSATLNYGFDVTITETSGSVSFQASTGIYTVGLSFSGDSGLENGTFSASFNDGQDSITFTLSVQNDVIQSGSGVFFNGSQVAIVSGNIDNPTVTNAEGDPLTEAELQALEQLFDGIGDVVELFFGLFEFAILLLGFGF